MSKTNKQTNRNLIYSDLRRDIYIFLFPDAQHNIAVMDELCNRKTRTGTNLVTDARGSINAIRIGSDGFHNQNQSRASCLSMSAALVTAMNECNAMQ